MSKSLNVLSKFSLPAALSFTLLAACGPAPIQPGTGPSASASPSAPMPSNQPSASAASVTPPASPSSVSSLVPSTTPSATSSPTSSPNPSPSTSPSAPLASATSDISTVERTTFNGKVFDDTTAPIDGVTVTAKSLNSSLPFNATSTTAGGAYAFNNAPAGVQIEISVSKPGFTTRRRVEVLKSNKDGNPDANKYDFGAGASSNGSSANALSDKPEVIAVTPSRNASGISPSTSFVLKFSEPMDRATVVDNFEVRAFTSEKLSVDTTAASVTLTGSGDVNSVGGTRIWDKAAFNVSWNSDDTEATFTFKEERLLPTDKDTDKVPDYQVSLERQDASIKDKTGITRSSSAMVANGGQGAFKLTEGNFERSFKFSVSTDTLKPRIDSLIAQTAENSGATSDGDTLRIKFSERMVHYTLGPTIAGGMGGLGSQGAAANNGLSAEAAAENYKVTVIRGGTTLLNQTRWSSLEGRAIFDTSDPSHQTVRLLPPATTARSFTVVSRPLPNSGSGYDAFNLAGNLLNTASSSEYYGVSQPGNFNQFSARYNINGSGANQTVTAIFVYTDGSTELANSGTLDADPNSGEVRDRLNALMEGNTGWTVLDQTAAGLPNNFVAGDEIEISLAANARRLSTAPQHGGKQIAYVLLATNAFSSFHLGASNPQLVSIVPQNGDVSALQGILNSYFYQSTQKDVFTVKEVNNGSVAGLLEPGDKVEITLKSKPIVLGNIVQKLNLTGAMFSPGILRGNNQGLTVGGADGRPDFFQPGDNIMVTVDSTVLDPAGNSIDSSGDDASANAS